MTIFLVTKFEAAVKFELESGHLWP